MNAQLLLPTPNPGDWLTREAAATTLDVHPASLYRLVARGTLREYRPTGPGANPMYWRAEVQALRDARIVATRGVQ